MPGSLWRLLKKLKAYFKKKERHCYLSLDFTQSPFILQLQYLPSYSFSPLPLRLQHLVLFQQFSSKGISCRLCLAALSVTGKEGCAAPPRLPANIIFIPNICTCMFTFADYTPGNELYYLTFSPNTTRKLALGQMHHEEHQIRRELPC